MNGRATCQKTRRRMGGTERGSPTRPTRGGRSDAAPREGCLEPAEHAFVTMSLWLGPARSATAKRTVNDTTAIPHHRWDRWTSDVSDHPLPDHPTVLLPFVPRDFRHGRRVRGLTDFARGVRQAGYRDGPFGRQQSPGPPLTDRFRAARTADMADSDMVVHRLIPRARDRHGPATRGRAEIAY